MSDIWFCEKQNSDDFQQKSAGDKPKKELSRDRNGRIKYDDDKKKKRVLHEPRRLERIR